MKRSRTEAWSYHNRVKPLLKASGCRYNRIENTAAVGMPDVDLTYQGLHMKIELKLAKGGKGRMVISDDQFNWHRKEHKALGNAWFLAYWVDKDELHMFKIGPKPGLDEEEKCRLIDYDTKIIEKWEDLFTIKGQ